MITTLANPSYKVVSQHGFADVWLNTSNNEQSLHTNIVFNEDDVIADFSASSLQSYPTYLTVQIGLDKHILLYPEFLQYINHSCEPNVFFDTTSMKLICIKPLQPGDELHFFYPSTEWNMAQPFVCNCGNSNCLQLINGAEHLSIETANRYKLTDFINQQRQQNSSL